MSYEVQNRVLATLMLIGDPKDSLVQNAMLNLNQDLFSNIDATELFQLIRKQFDEYKLFDITTLFDLASKDTYLFIINVCGTSCTTNLLLTDIQFLNESHKRRLVDARLKSMVHEFNGEQSATKSCEIAARGCSDIEKLCMVNEEYVFTCEKNADNFMDEKNEVNPIIPSNIETLDKLNNGGFKNKSLITIAGRSGMGKTGLGVHLAHHIASKHAIPHVLFYSLEMSASDIYEKQLTTILKKQISQATKIERFNAVAQANDTPFTIHTKPLASIDYIEHSARITAVKSPFSVIVVDYIGIVQNNNKLDSHTLKQADISLRLAALAIELNCIVIALTQVNRDYAGRAEKIPITSDAADSSGSERSSSYWLGIYRPCIDDDSQPENDFIIKCRKNRFGKPWTAYFAFNEATFGEVNQYIFNCSPMTTKKGFDNFKKQKST